MNIYKLAFIVIVLFSSSTFAKSKCQNEWDALKSVQSQLKHKSTEWLRDKERKKHTEYQDCRRGKIKSINSNNQTKYSEKRSSQPYKTKRIIKTKKSNFSGGIKGLFTGEKQNAWIRYYKKPKECIRPKTTKWFAKCLNIRDIEAQKFDVLWKKDNAPPAITLGTN